MCPSRSLNAQHKPRGIRKRGWAVVRPLTLALTVAVVAACGSSGSSGTGGGSGSGSSDSAANFFAGKTITFISPDKAGGTYDLYARLFAPALASILHATVNVEDVPGGGTITGTDKLASSSPDGLTIGDVNIPGDIGDKLQGQTALNVDLTKMSWIGQPAPQVEVWVTPESSGITSWDQVVGSKSTVSYGGSKSGVGWLLGATSMRAWKIPTKFETGYPTLVDLSQGVIADEFQVTEDDLSGDFYSDIVGKHARALMISGEPSLPSLKSAVSGVPTVAQEITKTGLSGPGKTALEEANSLAQFGFDFAAPPGLSAAKLTVLRQAFMEAAQEPSLQAAAHKEDLEVQPTNGAAIAAQVKQLESDASILTPYLK